MNNSFKDIASKMIDVVLSENMFAMAAASSATNALNKKPQSGSDSGSNLSGSKPKPAGSVPKPKPAGSVPKPPTGSAPKPAAPKAPQG